ncbi:MAG: phosphoglycerate kinase, partial [Patescibacteria group bacterium]|nr:phosphoglycerate kinase [Patescibacteria group bacterium]
VVIIAHLDRPKTWDKEKSLQPVAEHLAGILKYKFMALDKTTARLPSYQMPHVFFFPDDFHEPNLRILLSNLNPKDIVVLENLKFYPGEGAGDDKFAEALAGLAEFFVSDAFGSSYDGRASLALVPNHLPHAAGLELEKEVSALSQILLKPSRPYTVMAGGIKLSDKLEGLAGMLERADNAIVGGGLSTLFFMALGYPVGKSIIDEKSAGAAKELLRNFREKINLPLDVVVARRPENPESLRVTSPDKIETGEMVLDIGPETVKKFSEILRGSKTIVWSGPMGLFEVPQFSHGTKALGMLIATLAGGQAYVVAGGGNTLEAIKLTKVGEYFDFLSTGGSAMLKFLSGAKLLGVEALK